MVAWTVKGMGGLIPRTDSRMLPDNMAEQAVNCDLDSGALNGLPVPLLAKDLSAVAGTVRRAYRFPDPAGVGADAWLPLPSEYSSACRSPLANDTNHRLYWTNPGDTSPHWSTYADILASNPVLDLGIVQPGNFAGAALTVGPSGGVAPTIYRSYCFTYVNQYQEESAPNYPSAVVGGPSDATWTITGLPTVAPANPVGRNYPAVTGVNLYRTVTGTSTGGQFFLVAQFDFGTSPPTSPYVDTVTDVSITEGSGFPALQTTGWGNPPDNLDGLIRLPGGMLAGFTGNTIHFSEPDHPHTWPAAYDQSLGYTIKGFGLWQQSLVVLTEGFPSTGSGNSPANYVFTEVKVPEPCIARGSIITDLLGVYYASQNGLVMLNYYGMQNQTLSAVTKNEWINDFSARNLVACRHRAQFLAINGSGTGFLIDYSEQRLGFMRLNTFNGAVAVWNDEYTGDAYIMGGDKKVYLWDSPDTAAMVYRWRSKQFYTSAPVNIGAIQVSIDPSITTVVAGATPPLDNGDTTLALPVGVNAILRLYAGDSLTLIYTKNLTEPEMIFRTPSGFKAFTWQFEIVSRVPIHSVQLASTMHELKSV